MPLSIPFKIETHASLPSTQDFMRERLAAGEQVHGCVIRALEQTAARGQRRRDWWAGPGGSYQTLAVKDSEPAVLNKPYTAIAIGIGLAQVLPEYGIQVGLKWPNDVHYRGKKVAGILCEYVQGHLLAAVGLNVNNDVPDGAIALRGLDTEGASNFVLAGLQRGVEHLYNGLELAEAFAPFDVLYGEEIEVSVGREVLRGVASGLDNQGCLRLEHAQGLSLVCHGTLQRGPLHSVGSVPRS